MQALTQQDALAALMNSTSEESRLFEVPTAFFLLDWDHLDFVAWRNPKVSDRGYLVVQHDGGPRGAVLRASNSGSRLRSGMCDICHTMQPGDAVTMWTARKAGEPGARGDSVGTYMCFDLTCHDSVRLAAPLAPGEVRTNVDHRLDGTRARAERFIARVAGEL